MTSTLSARLRDRPVFAYHAGMDSAFGLHHLAHAHNAETGTDALAGHDARSMRDAAR